MHFAATLPAAEPKKRKRARWNNESEIILRIDLTKIRAQEFRQEAEKLEDSAREYAKRAEVAITASEKHELRAYAKTALAESKKTIEKARRREVQLENLSRKLAIMRTSLLPGEVVPDESIPH